MLERKKKYLLSIFYSLFLFFSILISQNSFAADSLSYSGRLVKADGAPVAGPVDLTVDLAYTNAPGTILCSQSFNDVVLSNGVFHLKLDLVCPGPPVKTLTEILSAVPPTFAAALRVTDVDNSKVYAFQALHAMPFANLAETSKQLVQLGAANGQVLKWNDTTKKWEPGTPGGGGTVTNVTVTSPLAVLNGATTPALSIAQASATVDGYLSSTDWNTFNNKVGVATGGTTLQFYRGDNSWQTLNTSVVPESGVTNLYFSNARVLGVPLDGFVAGPGVIVASDTVLQAFAKTQGQINSINTNSSAYVTKMGTSTMVAAGTIDAQLGFVKVGAPGSINDATPRGYVNDQDALKVSKAGDTISGVLTLDSDLKIKSGTTTNYVTIKGHATSDNYNLFLPSTDGNAGEVLQTDGAGNLIWVNPNTLAAGTGTVNSSSITDDSIMNADINSAAAIDQSKIAGLAAALGAKEPTLAAGTAAQYYAGDKTWQTLNTSIVPELTNLYFTEPRVRDALLTGVNTALAGTIAGTDSVLVGFGKTQKQLTDIASGVTANQWTAATGNVYRASGSVGIGIANPQSKLDVYATGLAGTTLPVVNIAASSFDNLGSDPTLLNLSTPTGGTPRGNIFKAANSNSSFTISNNPGVNGSSAFTTISSGGYTKFAPGYSGEKAMMAIGVNSANWFDGSTPVVGSAVNLNITAWGGSTPSYRDVYGVPVKIMASNPSATSTAFYADVTGAQNNWAFYATNGKSYFADKIGIGTTTPTASLHLKAGTAALNTAPLKLTSGVNLTTPEAGAIEYDGTNLYYTDNTNTRKTLGVTGAGITTLGGLSGTSQTFATGTAGTAPAFSSATTIHTLNIPMAATAAVTAGLISKADYDAFSAKQAAFTTSAALLGILTDETGSGSAVFSASPTFTGVPLAPTAAVDTNTTQIASTAFVLNQASSVAPLMNGVAAVGTSLRYTRADHIHPTDTSRAPAAGSTSITTLGTVTSGTWNGAVVDVPYGGTGKATLGLNKLLFGNGTAAVSELALPVVLTSSSVLLSSITTGAPEWTTSTTGNVLKGSLTGVAFGPLAANDLPAGTLSGSGTAGYIPYYSAATTLANSPMTVSGSNVGIGTATPASKFQVSDLYVNTTDMTGMGISVIGSGSDYGGLTLWDRDGNPATINDADTMLYFGDDAGESLRIAFKLSGAAPSEKMRVLSNGNVGIGTTTPTQKLDVSGIIKAGSATAVAGSTILVDNYSSGNLSTFGTEQSSGAPVLGYGVIPSSSIGSFLSSTPIALNRAAITVGSTDGIRFYQGAMQTVATNSAVTLSEVMRITQEGNVGIGTSAPTLKAHIEGSIGFPATSGTTQNGTLRLGYAGGHGVLDIGQNTGLGGWIQSSNKLDLSLTYPLILNPNGGNVGIGTTAPVTKFDVNETTVVSSTIGSIRDISALYGNAGSGNSRLITRQVRTESGGVSHESSRFMIQRKVDTSDMGFVAFNGGGTDAGGTSKRGISLGVGTTDYFTMIQNGNIGIGTPSPSSHLHVSANAPASYTNFAIENTAAGGNKWSFLASSTGASLGANRMCLETGGICRVSIDTVGNMTIGGTLTQSSDLRLKRDFKLLPHALESLSTLKGLTYYWSDPNRSKDRQIGLIAQDVEKVFPEVVYTDAQGFKSVAYQSLVAPMIEAFKEIRNWMFGVDKKLDNHDRAIASQGEEIKKLRDEVQKSHQENEQLKKDIAEIKRALGKNN